MDEVVKRGRGRPTRDGVTLSGKIRTMTYRVRVDNQNQALANEWLRLTECVRRLDPGNPLWLPDEYAVAAARRILGETEVGRRLAEAERRLSTPPGAGG